MLDSYVNQLQVFLINTKTLHFLKIQHLFLYNIDRGSPQKKFLNVYVLPFENIKIGRVAYNFS